MSKEELNELIDLLSEIDRPDISEYYPYCIGGIVALILIYVIFKVIGNIRRPREYIEDVITLEIDIQSLDTPIEKFKNVLESLYSKFYTKYKHKFFFSIELGVTKSNKKMYLCVPRVVYEEISSDIDTKFGKCLKLKEDDLQKFMKAIKGYGSVFQLELKKDFVIPLSEKINLSFENQWSEILEEKSFIYNQFLIRPISQKWLKVLEDYKKYIRKGKDPTKGCFGCTGAFINLTLVFLSLLARIFEFLIGSSKKDTDRDREISPEMGKKMSLVDEKYSEYGFEVLTRLLISGESKDDVECITEKVLNKINRSNEDRIGSNSLVISDIHKKVSGVMKNDFLLRYFTTDVVDVLNEKELASLILNMYN